MSNSITDAELLLKCRELIAEKLSWPPADEWRNYEFNELSEKILEATGIGLSTTTLKRLFGKVQYNNEPSSSTLNALARFLGHESWMHFKAQQQVSPTPLATLRSTHRDRTKLRNNKPFFIGLVIVGLLVVCGFLFLQGKPARPSVDASGIVFTSRPLAEGLPNTVVFKFDLKGIQSNDILIQQDWDSTRTIRIKPDQTEATGIYYRPGYFRAKLIVDGKVIKEHDLFIKSPGWMATIDNDPVPDYLNKDELIETDGMLDVLPAVKEIIQKFDKPVTMTYHMVKPFNISSDNFTFEASIKNTYGEGPAVCKTAKIFILCTKGAFIIPFTIPGCVSDVNLMMGEKYLRGKEHDLSAFGIDVSEWTDVKLEVRNKHVKIWANSKLIWEDSYPGTAGDIVGYRISFLGGGTIKQLLLNKLRPNY
jgi:hypothetical protein